MSTTQVDYCQSKAPLPAQDLDETMNLGIVGDIFTGYRNAAQVVACESASLAGKPLVAKFYDPLYAAFDDDEFPGPRDPVSATEHDFVNEACAYQELDSVLGGGLIPKYYASWKLELPLNGTTRVVFLVLMGHIQRIPLIQFDAKRLQVGAQLNVVAKVMEADLAMRFVGVNHNDLAPRNIFCDRDDIGDPELQIRVNDFNIARIDRYLGVQLPCLAHSLPVSPIQFYQRGRITALGEWENHYWSDNVGRMTWMKERWGCSKAHQPVKEEALESLKD